MSQESTRIRADLTAIRQASAMIDVIRTLVRGRIDGKSILWVDDHPENNSIILKLFKEAGARVTLAQSTKEAIGVLQDTDLAADLVISDMTRGDDPVAGLTLLALLHRSEIPVPRIIYSNSPIAKERSDEISRVGGVGPLVGPESLVHAMLHIFEGSGDPTSPSPLA